MDEVFVIIRREGADSHVVVPETYDVEGYVDTEKEAIDICKALNEDEGFCSSDDANGPSDLDEWGIPREEALHDPGDDEPLWYEWRKLTRVSAQGFIKDRLKRRSEDGK